MTTVVLDDAVRAKLRGADEVQLCDQSGQSIGYFLSEGLFHRLLYDWANAQISDEELEQRRREPGGRTLAEIWARLGSP
jgi:hypothetical protein